MQGKTPFLEGDLNGRKPMGTKVSGIERGLRVGIGGCRVTEAEKRN